MRRAGQRERGTRQLFADAELWVTPEVWERVEGLVREASALVHAEAKPPRSPGTVHVNLTAATFRMREESER